MNDFLAAFEPDQRLRRRHAQVSSPDHLGRGAPTALWTFTVFVAGASTLVILFAGHST